MRCAIDTKAGATSLIEFTVGMASICIVLAHNPIVENDGRMTLAIK
jgi:hypothetical protein